MIGEVYMYKQTSQNFYEVDNYNQLQMMYDCLAKSYLELQMKLSNMIDDGLDVCHNCSSSRDMDTCE
jgi:hypothetical protein